MANPTQPPPSVTVQPEDPVGAVLVERFVYRLDRIESTGDKVLDAQRTLTNELLDLNRRQQHYAGQVTQLSIRVDGLEQRQNHEMSAITRHIAQEDADRAALHEGQKSLRAEVDSLKGGLAEVRGELAEVKDINAKQSEDLAEIKTYLAELKANSSKSLASTIMLNKTAIGSVLFVVAAVAAKILGIPFPFPGGTP